MKHFNKAYHKGKYRSGEWAKHLRTYLKRVGNKRWRRTGAGLTEIEENDKTRKRNNEKRIIKVRITKMYYGGLKTKNITKYRKIRDAENAMRQASVISAEILEK